MCDILNVPVVYGGVLFCAGSYMILKLLFFVCLVRRFLWFLFSRRRHEQRTEDALSIVRFEWTGN